MRPFELNLLEDKVFRNYRRMDGATEVGLLLLVKDIQEYLQGKNIKATKEKALMLLLLTMANNHGPDMAIMIQRHINSCRLFYDKVNEHIQAENNKQVQPEPEDNEPAADEQHSEPEPETVTE